METHFQQELEELKKELLKMSTIVNDTILKSINALKNLSREEAEQIINQDKLIDELELKIEEKCLELLALHQPVAFDLRFICMAIKITNELERIADLAVDIAQNVLELANKPLLKELIDIPKLTTVAQNMIRDVIDAFINKNINLATKVILMDSEADNLRNLIQKELIDDYMTKNPTTVKQAIPLLLIARHLERICDHATNIAENIVYMYSAKIVKHHPERLKEKTNFQ